MKTIILPQIFTLIKVIKAIIIKANEEYYTHSFPLILENSSKLNKK